MQQEKIQLKNNLNTLFIDSPGSTFSCVQIWFKAGSALENKDDHGIAHFLEHMFFKGSKTTSGKQIAKQIEVVGGELNAFTSFDYTCYYANLPNTELKQGIKTILDMVSNPAFENKHIPSERNVVIQEYKKSIDNPSQFSFYELQNNFFSKGYNHPVLGMPKTINRFSRTQLIEFRKRFYNLSNAMLIIAGDLKNKQQLVNIIENYKIPKGPASTFPKFNLKNNSKISIHSKDVKMSQLNLLIQGPDFLDDNAPAEDLAFTCLGHGESSRLYSELVLDSTLANSCSSSTMFFSRGSLHSIRINFPHEHLNKVLNKLSKLLQNVFQNGFETKEINRIKNQYASSRIYEKESLESYAFSLGHSFAQTGSIFSEQEFLDKAKKTTPQEVNCAVKDVLLRDIKIQLQTPLQIDPVPAQKKLELFKTKLKSSLVHRKKMKKADKNQISNFDPQLKIFNLKKGINLLYRQNTMTPTYVLHTYLRGGLVDETDQTNGLFNLLTHNLSKGYNGIDYIHIKHFLENSSSTLQSFAGKNAYGLTLHGLTEHFSDTLDIFAGSLLSPDIPKDYLNHEKEMILRLIENQKKDPVRQCFMRVGEYLFNTHPYAFNNFGTSNNVSKLTKKILLEKHREKLNSENILFTYCGNQEAELIREVLLKKIDSLPERTGKKYKPITYSPKKEYHSFTPFEREQTQIFIGLPTKGITSNINIYLNIITTILSGQGSILFDRVREKQGLSYVVQPVHFSALDGGYWGIYMACGNENVEKAISTLNSIIDEIGKKGISKQAFNNAKKMIKGQSLLNIQTNEDFANIYSIPFFFDLGVDHFHNKNILIEKLPYNKFQKEIKNFFNQQKYTILVGSQD